MAGTQIVATAEAYYEINKEIVEEVLNSAKCLLSNVPAVNIVIQGACTSGLIKNKTQNILLLGPSHNWHGKPIVPYPAIMNDSAHFVHANHGLLNASDMAAVVYTTSKSAQGWLLAWSVGAGRNSENKVYVESGPVDQLTNWDNVKNKLCASRSSCLFTDPCAGTLMFAKITPKGDNAELAAIYEKC